MKIKNKIKLINSSYVYNYIDKNEKK